MPDRLGPDRSGPDRTSRVVRRAQDRYRTEAGGITTLHSFSYGDHYDPTNTGFGALLAINEEQVGPGLGYDAHRHSDVEIVTWVLDGTLAHRDTTGSGGQVGPGTAQRLSAGSGAEHTERNASSEEPLRFVQMMLRSTHDAAPEYATLDVPPRPGVHPAVAVHADAELVVVRPGPGEVVGLPPSPRTLVHVTLGAMRSGADDLGPGDELRVDDGSPVDLTGVGEALVWLLR